MSDFFFALRVHGDQTQAAPSGARLCSVLLDVVETADWRSSQPLDDEPELLEVSPPLLPVLLASAERDGFSFLAQVGRRGTVLEAVRSRDALAAYLKEVAEASHKEELYPIYLWLHLPHARKSARAAAERLRSERTYDDFLLDGGVTMSLVRSAFSIFLDRAMLPVALRWVESATAASALPVEWWPGDGDS
jgi:hypothetical protein